MNILVSCDNNYIPPLKTMLYSLHTSNFIDMDIYFIHSRVDTKEISRLKKYVEKLSAGNSQLIDIKIDDSTLHPTVTFYYTKEMYYRLFAYKFLPEKVDRILYLDPDIIVINTVKKLYDLDFEGNYFAAAPHEMPGFQEINKARLHVTTEQEIEYYYNSGVLMMDLNAIRKGDPEKEIFNYIDNAPYMASLLPDQDLLNVVFKDKIKAVPGITYNYDARKTATYRTLHHFFDINYVLENTSIIHFCGKRKPWNDNYIGRFKVLYAYLNRRARLLDKELKEV